MVSKSKLLKESDISLLKLYAGQRPDNTHSYHDREITDPVAQFVYQLKDFIPSRLSFREAEKVLDSLR